MANFTWRSLIVPVLSASTFLTAAVPTAQACCLFGGWGDCCGGGYSGFYRGYSSYYGGYAPSYGYGPAYGYGASYGYGPSYGYGSSYAYGYGNASSGNGCSTCAGGGCETYSAPANPTNPVPDESLGNPDDGYRPLPGERLRDREPRGREDVPVTPRRSKAPAEETPANGLPKKTLPAPPRDDGLGRETLDPMDEANPNDTDFEKPLNRRGSGTSTEVDPFGVKKPPMPKAEDKQPEETPKEKPVPGVDNDSFDDVDADKSTEVETKKLELGPPSDTEENAPADAEAVTGGEPNENGEVIKPRPAPFDDIQPEEAKPELPKEFDEADEKPTSAGVSPKVRLALRGKFGSPSIVRIKLRPNRDWQPQSAPPVLAKH